MADFIFNFRRAKLPDKFDKTPELLAPAGNMECLIAAVQNGADAVYFGGSAFNARRGANNFAGDELKKAVDHCRLRGVKTNVTLNTLLFDRELDEAMAFAKTLYGLGVTAVIVQDLGLAALIRRDLVSFLVGNLEYFQRFDHVKIYYDEGQDAPKDAVHDAFAYALSKEATVYRNSDYRSFRLAQVADYLCALELTEAKYAAHEETATDVRFFGKASTFRKNYLRQARRKLIT